VTALNQNQRIALVALATERGLVSPAAARHLLTNGLPEGETLAAWLLERCDADALREAISQELGIEHVDFTGKRVPYKPAADLVTAENIGVLRRYAALPLRHERSGQIVIATANPLDSDLTSYVSSRMPTGTRIALASARVIEARLIELGQPHRTEEEAEVGTETAIDPALPTQATVLSPAMQWIEATLTRAALEQASDIHLMWNLSGRLKLKMRIDGQLHEFPVPLNRAQEREAIAALLVRCPGVDSTNLREPVDGTFSFKVPSGARIDVRLGMLPQANGPTVALRLLDPRNVQGSLDTRGFDREHITEMRRVLDLPYGMLVVVGPTGSGKSTTLYTCLNEIDSAARNVHTVEDPVEYRLEAINQTSVRDGLGSRSITFARALRSILRLDPDVILVGEMRDEETAKTGLQAALSGHLLLSTLHANTAVQTYTRLVEMGMAPYLVSEAVTCSVSQRLLRTIHDCADIRPVSDVEKRLFARWGFPDVTEVPRAVGCDGCLGSGYRGRAAVLEVLTPSEQVRALVAERAGFAEIDRAARASGFRPMVADGLRLVAEGRTSIEEVLRTTFDNEGDQ
jgi:type II secretory ATPase GspE/PulE/Tfp pilus assembly ATPase PilB-like protein